MSQHGPSKEEVKRDISKTHTNSAARRQNLASQVRGKYPRQGPEAVGHAHEEGGVVRGCRDFKDFFKN